MQVGGGSEKTAVYRVLYVDDEPALCRAFTRLFADCHGLEVETTSSPDEALALLTRRDYDVIVSDLRMPGMNGIDLLGNARQARPSARRLLVSGFADLESALDAINLVGVDRLLTKPWAADELLSAVQDAAEHAVLRRENARINTELCRKTDQLSTMNRKLDQLVEERTSNLLDGLVSALDLRDSETQWHSRRVARYARRLAEEMGVTGRELDDIERGAMLHDIGKIGVRDAVLLKPGPLTEDEWTEMKRHPALGYEILRGIGFLEQARLVPLHHQERFDGTGYPAGLAGDQICLGARVFSVVDTYDAITSDRPYRKGRPHDVARAEIERCAGTQLDPRVVAAWMRVPDDDWRRIRLAIEALAAS